MPVALIPVKATTTFRPRATIGIALATLAVFAVLISAGWSGKQRHEVRTLVSTYFGRGLVFWAALNLYIGFRPGSHIDNLGHVGGLATGLALGTVLTGVLAAPASVRAIAGAC